MLEKEWFRPAGRGDECSFLLAQKGTNGPGHLLLPLRGNSPRDAPRGVSPMSAFAERALKVAPPWTPICVGRLTGSLVLSSGGHRRRKVRSIPNAQAWASVMPLPCSSSPHQTRFAGLWRGPRWTIWYFLPRGPRLSVCAARTPPALVKPGRPLLFIRRV